MPEASTSETSLMAPNGLAPEVVNARVAMLGFAGLVLGELSTGLNFWGLLGSGGLGAALLVSLAVTGASFAPGLRQVPWPRVFGKDASPVALGPFNPENELANGRAAMLGIAAISVMEGIAGTTVFFPFY